MQLAGRFHSFHVGGFHINFPYPRPFPPDAVMIGAMRPPGLTAAAGFAAPDKLQANFSCQRIEPRLARNNFLVKMITA